MLESRLSSRDWLAGERYTIADIACFAWIRNHDFIDLDLNEWPGVSRWHGRIAAREAAKRGVTMMPGMKSLEERKAFFAEKKKMMQAKGNPDKA